MAVTKLGGSLLDKIVDTIIPPKVVSFLNTNIADYSYFFFNYWSLVHIGLGVLFFIFFKNRFWTWVIINLIFETTEFILGLGGHPLFFEEGVDIFWDLLVTIGGYVVAEKVWERWKKFLKIRGCKHKL